MNRLGKRKFFDMSSLEMWKKRNCIWFWSASITFSLLIFIWIWATWQWIQLSAGIGKVYISNNFACLTSKSWHFVNPIGRDTAPLFENGYGLWNADYIMLTRQLCKNLFVWLAFFTCPGPFGSGICWPLIGYSLCPRWLQFFIQMIHEANHQ